MSLLVIEGLTQCHRDRQGRQVPALRDVSLAVDAGEFLVVIGPSGAGKTSLLRAIAGLDRPGTGTIHLGGRPMAGVSPASRDVALVFQDHPLFPHLNVEQNLAFALSLHGETPDLGSRVTEAAQALGLVGLMGRLPETLSGGERQRVALGAALVRRPQLLLLDEPLAQLDAPLRLQMRAELRDLRRRFGLTVIHVTHDQAEAMALADRLAVLHGGRLLQLAAPVEVYRRPAHVRVAEFLGSPTMNLVRGGVCRVGPTRSNAHGTAAVEASAVGTTSTWLFMASDGVPWPVAPSAEAAAGVGPGESLPVVLGIRPEDLRLGTAVPEGMTGLEVGIDAIERLGSESLVRLRIGSVRWIVRESPDFAAPEGSRWVAWFHPDRLHWFAEPTGQRL